MGTVRAREVFSGSALTVVAIESITVEKRRTALGYLVTGAAEPIGIVVRTANDTYALDVEARPLELEQLARDVPELLSILDLN